MGVLCLDHDLVPWPEVLAHLDEVVLGHGGPLLLHGGLQAVHILVGLCKDLELKDASHAAVQ